MCDPQFVSGETLWSPAALITGHHHISDLSLLSGRQVYAPSKMYLLPGPSPGIKASRVCISHFILPNLAQKNRFSISISPLRPCADKEPLSGPGPAHAGPGPAKEGPSIWNLKSYCIALAATGNI